MHYPKIYYALSQLIFLVVLFESILYNIDDVLNTKKKRDLQFPVFYFVCLK